MMAVSLSFTLSCNIYIKSERNQEKNLQFHLTQGSRVSSLDQMQKKKNL